MKEQVEILKEEYNNIKVKLDNAEYMLANVQVRGSLNYNIFKGSMKESEGTSGERRPNDMEEYDFVKM